MGPCLTTLSRCFSEISTSSKLHQAWLLPDWYHSRSSVLPLEGLSLFWYRDLDSSFCLSGLLSPLLWVLTQLRALDGEKVLTHYPPPPKRQMIGWGKTWESSRLVLPKAHLSPTTSSPKLLPCDLGPSSESLKCLSQMRHLFWKVPPEALLSWSFPYRKSIPSVYVHVHVHACTQEGEHAMCTCKVQRSTLHASLHRPHLVFLRQGLTVNLELADSIWLTSEPQGSPPVFALPVSALQTQAAMPVDSNSCPQARTAGTTLSMLCPQPHALKHFLPQP